MGYRLDSKELALLSRLGSRRLRKSGSGAGGLMFINVPRRFRRAVRLLRTILGSAC